MVKKEEDVIWYKTKQCVKETLTERRGSMELVSFSLNLFNFIPAGSWLSIPIEAIFIGSPNYIKESPSKKDYLNKKNKDFICYNSCYP